MTDDLSMPDDQMMTLSVMGTNSLRNLAELAAGTPRNGCFVEFGVYRGGSALHLARLAKDQGRALHLFDTFTGIPEQSLHDRQHKIGDFGNVDAATVMALIPSAVFHVGVFPTTMTEIGAIAFAHVDCDQYVSCLAAIEQFLPRLLPNGIMLFDDYMATSGVTEAVDHTFGSCIHLTDEKKAYVIKREAMPQATCWICGAQALCPSCLADKREIDAKIARRDHRVV